MKFLPILLITSLLFSAEGPHNARKNVPQKVSLRGWKYFDGNSIKCNINSSGPYADYLQTNSSGLFWPKGTNKTPVYTSGLWVIGRHRPTGTLRTAVQDFSTEFQPGPILSTYNTLTNSTAPLGDPDASQYRLYKINRADIKNSGTSRANPDYEDWPGDLGAPFNDLNNNGKWEKGIDTPKLFGDQTIWCVYNDGNPSNHKSTGTTLPLGIEVRALYYGFEKIDPLKNTMFIRWTIINRSDSHYDSLFVGLFSDTDLGYPSDDCAGYDSTLQLSYAYNGKNNDDNWSTGYGTLHPACGYVFLGGTPSLQPNAHTVYFNTTPTNSDPPLGMPKFPQQAYNFLCGLEIFSGMPIKNPVTNAPSRFMYSGDPVTNTGWTQLSAGGTPDDIRTLLSLGPVTLAPGDTQVVNAAFVIAQGTHRLNSVERLREDVGTVHAVYQSDLTMPVSTIRQTANDDSITFDLTLDVHSLQPKNVSLEIVPQDSSITLASVPLFDDGTHGDVSAGDGIFRNSIGLRSAMVLADFNARIVDKNNRQISMRSIHPKLPMIKLRLSDPIIYSDDLNQNGKAEPGENIRFGVNIFNPHPFTIGRLSIGQYSSSIQFQAIQPLETIVNHYEQNKTDRYLSVVIPDGYRDSSITVPLSFSDSLWNSWTDSVSIPVVRPLLKTTTAARIKGSGDVDIRVTITDRSQLRNHLYVLRGTDSSYYFGLVLKDSIENRELFRSQFYGYNSGAPQFNHALPLTDGFKVKLNLPAESWSQFTSRYYFKEGSQWIWVYPYSAQNYGAPKSTVHFADIPATYIKFSRYTGFTDTDSSKKLNVNEPYTFDTTDSDRTQKAFLYSASNVLLGFVNIPFAVYEIGTGQTHKLSVALKRTQSTDTSRRWIMGKDQIYVMAYPYNSDGKVFDPALGGLDLRYKFVQDSLLPYYYVIEKWLEGEPLRDTGSVLIEYSPTFSSRDVFIFNPTDISIGNLPLPETAELEQNYPNPFNPSTTIRYSVPVKSFTSIAVYNILGQKVRTLFHDLRDPGTYEVEWNGRNESNLPVASGLYLCRFESSGKVVSRKMLFLK